MIDHISLAVSDLEKSRAFYDRALAELGAVRQRDFADTDHAASGYGTQPGNFVFWIGAALPPASAGTPPHGQHVAFHAENRTAVDAFYREAMAAGAVDNGAPGLRPHYHPSYYAAFVIDPDGHHLEAVCHQPE